MIESRGVVYVLAAFLFLGGARLFIEPAPGLTTIPMLIIVLCLLAFVGIAAFRLYMGLKEETELGIGESLSVIAFLTVITVAILVVLFGPGGFTNSAFEQTLTPIIRWVGMPLLIAFLVYELNKLIEKNKERSAPPEPVEVPKEPEPQPEPEKEVVINLRNRFEHTHILGGTGSGKTQLIQFLISKDLADDCTIIVIDNQRQMINKLARLGQDMALISPRYDLSLNLFDRPRADTTVNLLKYVLSGLMESALTPKQELIFEFGIQLMLVTPKATINTFRQLLDAHQPDLTYISRLDDISREFFQSQFMDKQYDQTKKEISWRIWSLLKNPLLAKMFTSPTNKVEISREINRRLILIDCDVDKLQEYSGFFGRFFIAQLLELAQARFVGNHKPVYVYIDECYYYLDQNIASMLETARKAKMGLIMAHQYLGQITEPKMRDAIMALTSTKFASSLSPSDTYAMAQAMHCHVDVINRQRKLQFALWQRGDIWPEPFEIQVPAGVIESYPTYPIPDELMRNRYAQSEKRAPEVTEPPEEPKTFPTFKPRPRKPLE